MKIRLISVLLTLALLLCCSSAAALSESVNEKYLTTAAYLQQLPTPQVGSIGGEWLVIGLQRAGMLPEEMAKGYYQNVIKMVTENGSAKLHRSKSTENARVILALTAIGKDVTDVAGHNLLEPLADFNYVKKQGVNGPVWTLIAFDSLAYDIPLIPDVKVQTTRELLIQTILDSQSPGGGWDIAGKYADPDMSGMAIQALAPYYNTDQNVKAAVDDALLVLSENQQTDGSFNSLNAGSPESSAQMITALAALQIHPETDSRFIKNGNSAVTHLMSFAVQNGFAHTDDGEYNQMSTEQSFYALTALRRMEEGKFSLYDMCDLLTEYDVNLDGKVNIIDATAVQRYIAELEEFSLRQLKVIHADSGKAVDITFVTELQNYIAEQ